jgi:pilus assembly protein CpaF
VSVPVRVENDVIETETVFERVGDELVAAGGMPPRLERFHRAGIDVHAIITNRPQVGL